MPENCHWTGRLHSYVLGRIFSYTICTCSNYLQSRRLRQTFRHATRRCVAVIAMKLRHLCTGILVLSDSDYYCIHFQSILLYSF